VSRMKRASYREGVEIIALNDEPTEMDPEAMIGFASVMLLAALFGVEQSRVAADVVKFRKKWAKSAERASV
jgi:hypothetical protein